MLTKQKKQKTKHSFRDSRGRFSPVTFVPEKLTLQHVPLYRYLAQGNSKLPNTTAIFNLGTAKDCPSLKLGFCQAYSHGKLVCYALKAERQYPNVIPYRQRQTSFWQKVTAQDFVYQFLLIQSFKIKKPFNALRFNESGDFWGQDCIQKADTIAQLLGNEGVRVYGYTARQDLDFSQVKYLVLNGSGFKKDGIANEFKMVETKADKPKGYGVCYGDCRVCRRCLFKGNDTVVIQH